MAKAFTDEDEALLAELGGTCHSPVAALAVIEGDERLWVPQAPDVSFRAKVVAASGGIPAGSVTFTVGERAARTGRDPRTKEPIKIKAAKVPKFKAGKALKDAVN